MVQGHALPTCRRCGHTVLIRETRGFGEPTHRSPEECENVRVAADVATQKLRDAIRTHHDQRADDRCWEDDDRLYEAAELGPTDRRVGSKEEMLANCRRFVERRCESGGPWPSYAELQEEVRRWHFEDEDDHRRCNCGNPWPCERRKVLLGGAD